jgi:probable addiction module antidote protein
MTIETKPFDAAEHLNTEERIAAYLADVFHEGDAAEIAAAIGTVARARGMTEIANKAGITREALFRSLSAGGNPTC